MFRTTTGIHSLCVLLLVACLSACGIDSSQTNNSLGSVSIGQQLIDLKAAQDDGLISEREYKTLRKKLLRSLSRSLEQNNDDDDDDDDDDRSDFDDDDKEGDDDSWLF